MSNNTNLKQCLHKFRSVYRGSEWDVECEKCNENVFDLYELEDAVSIVNEMLLRNKKKENETKSLFSWGF